MGYSHPDHGEIECYQFDGWRKTLEGYRCKACHVIAEPGNEDETFDNHDCSQYEAVRNGIRGQL